MHLDTAAKNSVLGYPNECLDIQTSAFGNQLEKKINNFNKTLLLCVKWGCYASRLLRFVSFVHVPFSFRSPDFFCRVTVFYVEHSVLCCVVL